MSTLDPVHRKRTHCRGCGGQRLPQFLSLGPTPLANSFLHSAEEFATEASYPLDVYFCRDCSLVQLLDVIDPAVMFRDYIYVTGTSSTIAQHNELYAGAVKERLDLSADDLVVEVASNDGSLLKCFQKRGVPVLGIEPARNIAEMAVSSGIPTVPEFFSSGVATQVRAAHGPAKAVIGNNVLAHVDDTIGFLVGCRELIGDQGRVIVEVPYLGELLHRLEYDTIYHEHLCYFSITALLTLYAGAGLAIERIDRVPVHGGSLRIWAQRSESDEAHGEEVMRMAAREAEDGLTSLDRYARFAEDVAENRRTLRGLLEGMVADGRSLAGYGAPAKGNTLLNYCGIGTGLLPYTVDRNSLKVGTFTPGTHIPVRDVSTLAVEQPDAVLILPWNLTDEIVHQQVEYRSAGGQFVVPIPIPEVIAS